MSIQIALGMAKYNARGAENGGKMTFTMAHSLATREYAQRVVRVTT